MRYQRVNVRDETVEEKVMDSWEPMPEKEPIRGCGAFGMYPDIGRLDDFKERRIRFKPIPVGDSLDGMKLIGEINTRGRFKKCE